MSIKHKAVKALVKEKLNDRDIKWTRMTKKEKRELLEELTNQTIREIDERAKLPDVSETELLGITQLPQNWPTLEQMRERRESYHRNYLPYKDSRDERIVDRELREITDILEDGMLYSIVPKSGYKMIRLELLKVLKYPTLSYRKYVEQEINNPERKENRAFCRFNLRVYGDLKRNPKCETINHATLSKFRSKLSPRQRLELLLYFVVLLTEQQSLANDQMIAFIDSTDVATKVKTKPVFEIEYEGQKIRFYHDIDADMGRRQMKSNKSKWFVGYRVHTLTLLDHTTSEVFPLISIVAPANHHDSQLLTPLVSLAYALGLTAQIKVAVADSAYAEKSRLAQIRADQGICVATCPSGKTTLPADVDPKSYEVYFSDACETPMKYGGKDDAGDHEYRCQAAAGHCPFEYTCPRYRLIHRDTGHFNEFPQSEPLTRQLLKQRPKGERMFALLKNQGLETVHVLRRCAVEAVTMFAQAACILKLLAKRRLAEFEVNDVGLFKQKLIA